MSDLVLLSLLQMRRIEPHFSRSRGLARVDDRRVISGIAYVIRQWLQWKDAPTSGAGWDDWRAYVATRPRGKLSRVLIRFRHPCQSHA